MSYTVNWTTKVITVPLADLTLISGSNYSLDAGDFWIEMRRLEASPADGLWAEQAVEYINTQVLSGITYSAIVKLINGYTWDTDTTNKNIFLIGFNSNLLDAFIPGNGISVLANNSAGKSGSGLSTEEATKLAEIYAYMGLDSTNPIEHTPTQSVTDDTTIDVTRSGDGTALSRLVRQ